MSGPASGLAAEAEVAAPRFAEGDWWLLRTGGDVRGRGFRAKVMGIDGEHLRIVEGPAQSESIYDLQLNKLEGDEPPSGDRTTYRPHSRSFEFPLFPGKRWGGVVEWTSGPHSGTFTLQATVGDYEPVALRFATGKRRGETEELQAFRIEYEHTFPGRVTKSTCWYAPEIKIPVRCESTDPMRAYEVIDYAVAGDPALGDAPRASASPSTDGRAGPTASAP